MPRPTTVMPKLRKVTLYLPSDCIDILSFLCSFFKCTRSVVVMDAIRIYADLLNYYD